MNNVNLKNAAIAESESVANCANAACTCDICGCGDTCDGIDCKCGCTCCI